MASDDRMEAIVAARFSPYKFAYTPGFPNTVLFIDVCGDDLLWFREKDEDNPAHYVIKFHQYMDQLSIHHEDILMKMFMYSLEGYARQ